MKEKEKKKYRKKLNSEKYIKKAINKIWRYFMGTNLILKKGKHWIDMGRAYHFEETEEEIIDILNKLRQNIILACFKSWDESSIAVNELFDELSEWENKLTMRRHINHLIKYEGYKEFKE
jgi:hypothetical protein